MNIELAALLQAHWAICIETSIIINSAHFQDHLYSQPYLQPDASSPKCIDPTITSLLDGMPILPRRTPCTTYQPPHRPKSIRGRNSSVRPPKTSITALRNMFIIPRRMLNTRTHRSQLDSFSIPRTVSPHTPYTRRFRPRHIRRRSLSPFVQAFFNVVPLRRTVIPAQSCPPPQPCPESLDVPREGSLTSCSHHSCFPLLSSTEVEHA